MPEPIDDGRRQSQPQTKGTTAMNSFRIHFLLALLATAAISSQAQAGMSGTSERVQQQTITQAQASAPPQPKQQVQAQQRRSVARQEQAPRSSGGSFDGIWAVASSPGCGLVARSAVQVIRGRISGDGVSGSIDASGNVRTVGYGGGLSVISKGRVSGTSGSGTYEVSNGCTGTWVAQKA
jgi:hypothetical protein